MTNLWQNSSDSTSIIWRRRHGDFASERRLTFNFNGPNFTILFDRETSLLCFNVNALVSFNFNTIWHWLNINDCVTQTAPISRLFFFYCGSTVLIRTQAASHMRFLELFRHMVGLLGRVISPSQGLYLHRTTQHRKTRDKHPCLGRDSNPRSQQPTGQDPRLRPHGHCDRHIAG
jgi:hypothetical protein